VAYDEDLANRVRELIAGEPDVTEKKMFGGLAFLVGGNMSVGASGQGGLMVRVDPKDTDALVTKPHARPFEMRARAMQGWLRVEAEGLRTKRQLEARGRVRARSSSKALKPFGSGDSGGCETAKPIGQSRDSRDREGGIATRLRA